MSQTPEEIALERVQKAADCLNHDYKDYRMTMIGNPANQGSHHGNQENHG